jgi:hypothetical protein
MTQTPSNHMRVDEETPPLYLSISLPLSLYLSLYLSLSLSLYLRRAVASNLAACR